MFAAGGYPWVDRNAEKVIDWMSAAKVIHVELRQCVNTYRRSCTVYSFGRGLHRMSIYRISVDKIDEILFSISLEIFVLGFLWNFLTVCRSFLLTYFFFFF